MGTKEDIILAIQEVANETNNPNIKIALGTPGDYETTVMGDFETGSGWQPEPKPWPVVIEGLADYFNATVGKFTIRQISASGAISQDDKLVELVNNSIAIELPAPQEGLSIVIKPMNVIGCSITTLLDGAFPTALLPYEAIRVYSNGSGWFTW